MSVLASTHHNVAALLARTAAMWPRLPALAEGSRVIADYGSFLAHVRSLASGLRVALEPGERVALVARNRPDYVEALFACWWAGLVAVPVNAKLHVRELEYVLDHAGARLAFVDGSWAAALGGRSLATRLIELGSPDHRALRGDGASALAPVARDDPAWLFYTSGTTGRPKGVVISHGNLHAMAQGYLADVAPVAPGDTLLHPAPLSHGSGLYLVPHVARGACNVVPESGGFEPDEVFALIAQFRGASFFAAPTMVKRLVEAPGAGAVSLPHLNVIVYGGGPLYVEDARAAHGVFGARLAQIYGQGESPMTITAMDRALFADAVERGDDARLGSVGVAQAAMDVRTGTVDAAARFGEIGEVLVRGPAVMQGYWRNPEATAATLAGGWLHTGDLGVLDADGFLTLKDRSKDLIISGGTNIYPREVEEVLLRHPDVREVAVVGRRHAEWGEEVVACVVARTGPGDARAQEALARALDALCLDSIARFKRPRAYRFVAALPKNNAGKVLKTALRETVAEPDADA